MTREDAERKIRAVFTNYFYFAGDREADEVIEALRQEPKYCDRNICVRNEHNGIGCGECEVTKSQEPCEDAISRKAVLDKLNRLIEVERLQGTDEMGYGRERVSAYECMIHNIESEYLYPNIQPQPKTGHWIEEKSKVYKCSNCSRYALEWGGQLMMSRYCPNCGAKMAESEDNE